jgi:hypothetical protein
MDETIKRQPLFVLSDDNEMMQAALEPDSDLDNENKQMNRELIKKHEALITKVEKNQPLSQEDLQLIRDANEIHLNDVDNLNGHHKQALELDNWLDLVMELSTKNAFEILEEHLHQDSKTPAVVFRALHTLWEEITPDDITDKPAFDQQGKCLKCGSRVSFAEVTDTLFIIGDETVKRYDGDITNRNCVKCTYPKQYDDYKEYDQR